VLTQNLSSKKKGKFCHLQIKDNGIGMNMAKIGKKLFKAFTRFNKKTEGKGIGLHIVKKMVEKNREK
jgi:signal transduction histidine kinase